MSKYTLPDLPYELDALEPHISKETLQFHYNKHHAGYVSKLNDMVEGSKLEGKTLEELILTESSGKVFNNAAQIWNHTFYWHSMTPNAGTAPSSAMADEINKAFGSMEDFNQKFAEVATGQFGSGWAWLVRNNKGGLDIVPTPNAETPLKSDNTPLLVCDVWEHAYYIDYRNDRGSYVQKFLEIINWEFAEKNLSTATNGGDLKNIGASS